MESTRPTQPLSLHQCLTLACILEATAPKPGNVHRGADFEDLSYADLLVSAVLLGPILARAAAEPVGATVLAAVRAMRNATGTNTHLGSILLLAPLAAVPESEPLDTGVRAILSGLNAADAAYVYQAIRAARPGGLGSVGAMDIHTEAPTSVLSAMSAAAERDLVARQYVNDFQEVFGFVRPHLCQLHRSGWALNDAIVQVQLELMARFPDSLIARKCGPEVAGQSAARARRVLAAGTPERSSYRAALADLDFWLRSDGHRRNPGTSADLIAAGLFAALRSGALRPPFADVAPAAGGDRP